MASSTRTPTRGINGTAVFVVTVGGVILVSGLTNKKISQVVLGFLQGTAPVPETLTTDNSSGAAYSPGELSGSYGGEHSGSYNGTSAVGGTPVKNKAIGKLLAAPYGWATGAEWDALDKLWTQESGWRNTAENPSSGALGIAQALPPTKYPKAAQKPLLSASAQIAWGLAYIKDRYGDPLNAWGGYWSRGGWY